MSYTKISMESNENNNLPFLSDWLEDTSNEWKDGETNQVKEIILAQSGKGYLAKTEKFVVFLWKNSEVTKNLIKWIEQVVSNEIPLFGVMVQIDTKAKNRFALGVSKDEGNKWEINDAENGYFALAKYWNSLEELTSHPSSTPNPTHSPKASTDKTRRSINK